MNNFKILLFAKAPIEGTVKTRLIPELGEAGAAALYRRMVTHCLRTTATAFPGSVELWCAPDVSHPFFIDCASKWQVPLRCQSAGNLGVRMSAAMRTTLDGSAAAVIIGTDVPSITAVDISAALAALAGGRDAALVPVDDGGYGLIALSCHRPRLFEGIAWSTPSVMAETRSRLQELCCNWIELPARWDVDQPSDLTRLMADKAFRYLVDPSRRGTPDTEVTPAHINP